MGRKTLLTFLFLVFTFFIFLIAEKDVLNTVNSEPPLTIKHTYVTSKRCDIIDVAQIGFQIVNSSNNSPFIGAKVYLKGSDTAHLTDDEGWCLISVYSDKIEKKSWSIDRIYFGDTRLDFQQNVPDPTIIFDKVLIHISTLNPRIGVNTEAPLIVEAKYASDDSPFSGKIYYNYDSLASDHVGKRVYKVKKIIDKQYSVTKFDTNSVEIIYDRIDILLTTSEKRLDLGTEADIKCTATYSYDNTEFKGSIELNDTLIKNTIGKYSFTVSSIKDDTYNIESFKANIIDIIYDIIIINLTTTNSRINVGDTANISYSSYYASDSEPFIGTIELNNKNFVRTKVSDQIYQVENIKDNKYNLISFTSDKLKIIWDIVHINLSTEDDRINVGDEAKIAWNGYYEYDKSDFKTSGRIILNSYNFSRNHVGDFRYEVKEIIDDKYNLTRFNAKPLTIIWDEVDIEIFFENQRLEAGIEAKPTFIAEYKYDHTPFEGKILLNDTLLKTELKKHEYRVSSITDTKYGLTKFKSCIAQCYYDKIILERVTESVIPGSITFIYKAFYESDGAPVQNAELIINNVTAQYLGEGKYRLQITNWLPQIEIQADFITPGFSNVIFFESHYCVGNIGLLTFTMIFTTVTTSIFLWKRKNRNFEKKILDSLSSDEIIIFDILSKKINSKVNNIINTTRKILIKGSIFGVISFDNKCYIPESILQSSTNLYELNAAEIINKISDLKSPASHKIEFKFKDIKSNKYKFLLDIKIPHIKKHDDDIFCLNYKPNIDMNKDQLRTHMQLLIGYTTCSKCKGNGWFYYYKGDSTSIKQLNLYYYHICHYCYGSGFIEIPFYIMEPSYFIKKPKIKTKKINIKQHISDIKPKIIEKQFVIGKTILENTPGFSFDPSLSKDIIISASPTLFSKTDRELVSESLTFINGVYIPKRPEISKIKTKVKKRITKNNQNMNAENVYIKRDAKKAGNYRKKLRGR